MNSPTPWIFQWSIASGGWIIKDANGEPVAFIGQFDHHTGANVKLIVASVNEREELLDSAYELAPIVKEV